MDLSLKDPLWPACVMISQWTMVPVRSHTGNAGRGVSAVHSLGTGSRLWVPLDP